MLPRLLPPLSERRLEGELMDDPSLGEAEHQQALAGLRRINRVTNSTRVLWQAIRQLASIEEREISVVDVACGGGDVLVDLGRRAHSSGVSLQLTGLDISPTAVRQTEVTARNSGVQLDAAVSDVLGDDRLPACDVVYCSLFLHHLNDEQSVSLLKRMKEAGRESVLVSDLLRSRMGYAMAWTGTRLLSRSRIVHVDGPLSVKAAYTLQEVTELANRAGLRSASIAPFWPQRFLLQWSPKPEADQ